MNPSPTPTAPNSPTSTAAPSASLWRIGAAAGLVAAAVNASIYLAGRAAGVEYVVRSTTEGIETIGLVDVIGMSLAGMVVGLIAAALARRLGRPSLRTMEIVGAVVALLSTTGDFGIEGGATAKATLIAMHAVVLVAYVVTLERVRASASIAGDGRSARSSIQPAITPNAR